ncbi:MAG: PAS domain S-box protein [Mariprofundus sp.]|nr:PAS domain S-box protein [Mariprofundus sp.]
MRVDSDDSNVPFLDSSNELNFQQYALDQHAIVAVTDRAGRITSCNDKFVEISGYERHELIGQTHRIVHSDYHPKTFFIELWQTISAGDVWQGNICNRNKNGEHYWVGSTIISHLDEHGKPDRYMAIRYDVTQQILAQQAIENKRQLLEVLNHIQSNFLLFTYPLRGFNESLQSVLSFTKSQYACVVEAVEAADGTVAINQLSALDWNPETHEIRQDAQISGQVFHHKGSIFADVIRKQSIVFSNDPCRDWQGEKVCATEVCATEVCATEVCATKPCIDNILALPLFNGEKVIGILALANRQGGYDASLFRLFKPLALAYSRVLDAYQIDKQRRSIELDLARFKSTVDIAIDCIFMFDPDSLRFFYLNQGAINQLGYSREEMFQMTPLDIKPNLHEDEFRKMRVDLIKEPMKTLTYETIHRHKNGNEIEVEVILQYISPADEPPRFVAFVHDITERLQIQRQLQQAQKMQTVGQLTAGIAHDFNNMLASILGFNGLAQKQLPMADKDKIATYLQEVNQAGERARDLVRQLLDFSRVNSHSTELVAVSPLVKEVARLLKATMPSTIQFSYQLEDNLPYVCMDPIKLHQILMNMMINARDAIDGTGRINVQAYSLDYQVASDLQANPASQWVCDGCHHDIEAGHYVVLCIRDSGSGMDQTVLQHIFEPFFTTKEVGQGTGMGLSTVLGIMHQQQGHLLVDSKPGVGTVFKLLFRAEQAPQVEQELVSSSNGHSLKHLNETSILVIDDEPSLAMLMGEILDSFGVNTTIMTDSRKALQLFKANPESFDLVITDQTMPYLKGHDLAVEMLAIQPDLPIILYSGHGGEDERQKAESLGIRACLAKPMNVDQLIEMLCSLLSVGKGKNTV